MDRYYKIRSHIFNCVAAMQGVHRVLHLI